MAAAVAVVLPLLLTVGVPSSVAEVRRLSLNTVTKLVKQASPALLRPHVADLVVNMLEGLSTLEDSRLNYYQLHVDRMDGRAAEQLESARVAAARDSPMWATLDLCLRQVGLHAAKPGFRRTLSPHALAIAAKPLPARRDSAFSVQPQSTGERR